MILTSCERNRRTLFKIDENINAIVKCEKLVPSSSVGKVADPLFLLVR